MRCKRLNCRAVWLAFNAGKARELSEAGSELWAVDPEITRVSPTDEIG